MEVQVKTITPSYARKLLNNNPSNRLIRARAVESMARDISNGKWQLTGESIKISSDGSLIDGQHRLSAVVKADTPIQCLVCYQVDLESMTVIDSGSKRTIGDRFKINNVANPHQVAAILNLLNSLARGQKSLAALTPTEAKLMLDKHPNVRESAVLAHRCKIKGTATMLGAAHYVSSYIGHSTSADEFAETFITGVGTYPNDAARFLREHLIADYMKANRMSTNFKRRLFFHALNKYLARDPMTRAQAPETFGVRGWTVDSLGIKS